MDSPKIRKETKNKIYVDYADKTPYWQRVKNKFTSSYTWVKILIGIFRFVLMLGVSYVILYPFFTKIAGSFMSRTDVIDSTVNLIPKHFTLEIYQYLIEEKHYFSALLNTTLLSLSCALIQTFICCMIGYGFAKFKFKGNKALFIAVVVTMIIPHNTLKLSLLQHFSGFDIGRVLSWDYKGIIELIMGSRPQLTNTFWPLIILSISGLAFKNGLYIFMMRQFFKGVPDELEESAYVDGSGVFRTFFQIIIPLSVPMLITIFLFSFSWQWTDNFYTTLFFTDTAGKMTLMPDLFKNISDEFLTDYSGRVIYENVVKNTAGIMIIAPLIIIYLFCQKYLVQGIERSGIVG